MKEVTAIIISFLLTFCIAAPWNDMHHHTNVSNCPIIISRHEWGARTAKAATCLPFQPAPYVVVHHGGTENYCFKPEECAKIVRSYQNHHIDTNKWWDIGYHFVIGEDGYVYEGRGWDKVGAHAPGYNTQSIGICIIGDFNYRLPHEIALKALNQLMYYGVQIGKLSPDFKVIGHRQARDTECPGDYLFNYIEHFPNWTNHPIAIFANQTNTTSS